MYISTTRLVWWFLMHCLFCLTMYTNPSYILHYCLNLYGLAIICSDSYQYIWHENRCNCHCKHDIILTPFYFGSTSHIWLSQWEPTASYLSFYCTLLLTRVQPIVFNVWRCYGNAPLHYNYLQSFFWIFFLSNTHRYSYTVVNHSLDLPFRMSRLFKYRH